MNQSRENITNVRLGDIIKYHEVDRPQLKINNGDMCRVDAINPRGSVNTISITVLRNGATLDSGLSNFVDKSKD